MVSGVWGYAVQPLLNATDGYRFIDFRAGKLPPDESGSLVLVIPADGNPYANGSDLRPDDPRVRQGFWTPPVCTKTAGWCFVRLELQPVADP